MRKLFLIFPLLFILTGCYNYHELNDLAIVSAMSISKSKDSYHIAIQVVNTVKEQDATSSDEPSFINYKASGKSLQKAFSNIIKDTPKKIYGNQMQLLIIDEGLAREGISDILDFLARDPNIRNEFYVAIGRDKDILDVLTPLDNVSGKNILDKLKASNEDLGIANMVTFNDLIANFQNKNIEVALPTIKIDGNRSEDDVKSDLEESFPDKRIVISNLSIFKNNKLLGYLNERESLAYNFIMDNITHAIIVNKYKNSSYISLELINSKTKKDIDIKNKLVKINIKGKASITESNYNINLTHEDNIKKIEKDLNKNIEKIIKESIDNNASKYSSDIYGFKEMCYKSSPKYYKKVFKEWDKDLFNNIKVKVKSDIEIVEQGNLLGGIKHE